MAVITDRERINLIFDRGIITQVLPTKEALIERLLSGERLRIYSGYDPTSTSLHLSHAKNFMLLEELRQLGHEVIVLFGDFTAQIGDPTERANTRPVLSADDVKRNAREWVKQIEPLLDFSDKENPPRILYNSEWLSKLSMDDIIKLASHFTVQQMIERDMFDRRIQEGSPIHLHEFLYPLMQGYDSVAMDVDVELCGTDQTFNALAGRTLLKKIKNKEKYVIAVNMMENPKTGELMSKSRGTGVFLASAPDEMFGSIMAQPDEMIELLFVNNTRIPLERKDEVMETGPRQAKELIACEIVKKFHGEAKAEAARKNFIETFKKGAVPENVISTTVKSGTQLGNILVENKIVDSKAEFRRLCEAGAISNIETGEKITDPAHVMAASATLRVGKHRFLKIIVE